MVNLELVQKIGFYPTAALSLLNLSLLNLDFGKITE